MSTLTRDQLWQRLQQQALVDGDLPPADAASSPWYVRVMLGIAGWIGALFLMGFVGVGFSFVMKSATASMIVGVLCCGGAFAIFRAARNNDFAMQFGLAVSLAGQGMFMVGLSNAFRFDTAAAFFLIAAFETALAALLPNFIHRVVTSAAAAFALTLALSRLGIHGIAPGLVAAGLAMVWLNERHWAVNGGLWRPIGYGLALTLLQIESTRFFDRNMIFWLSSTDAGWWMMFAPWIGTALVAAVLVWAVTRIVAHEDIGFGSAAGMAAIAAAIAVGALSFVAPGLATALLILLLGYASGNRILIGLGLIGLLGFVSHYYYTLQTTLLVKSMVLAASGITLLLARLALHRFFPLTADQENPHA